MKSKDSPTYTAAVIGTGPPNAPGGKQGGNAIGYGHARTYAKNPRTKLVAAADINAANLAAFQAEFAATEGFADYRKMLDRVRPDIVSICTYLHLHAQMVVDAARAGAKAIICEKPFLASPEECVQVRRVVEETGVKIVVPHVRRMMGAFRRAREVYNDGSVGQPMMCIAGLEGWDLAEWGAHWLDMFRFFHQDRRAKWVMGQARVRDERGCGHAMEDHAVAYFEFEGGGKALLDGGRGMDGEATMTLVGTEGAIRVMQEDTVIIQNAKGQTMESFAEHPKGSFESAWDRMLADLVAWLEGGPEPELGLTNALGATELYLAAYISSLRGDRVDLPLHSDLDEWPVDVLARRAKGEQG